MRSTALLLLTTLLTTLAATTALAAGEPAGKAPIRLHVPEGGLPPLVFLPPNGQKPAGIVADLLETAAREAGRPLRYEFLPREQASEALTSRHADVAMFFQVTRPARAGLRISPPVLTIDSLLVTLRERPLDYRRTGDLRDLPLCLLTDETHPPLALLAMNGHLFQRRAKTEQAQLMMLRNGDCAAAVINSPAYAWLQGRYGNDDLLPARTPLLSEALVLGFGPDENALAGRVDALIARLQASGELDRLVKRHLPSGAQLSQR